MASNHPGSRVLLVGATGNLGLRLIPALLAHAHTVTAYVRSPAKLQSLAPSILLSQIVIVAGDATDSLSIKQAILDHDCDAVVDVAGNQVLPWRDYVLPKIAQAVVDAAVAVGRERGKPLRAWVIGGMNSLEYPGTGYLVQDFMPKLATIQHQEALRVLEAVPVEALCWSCLCVAMMVPATGKVEPLDGPRSHNLLLKADTPPGWEDHWVKNVPLFGVYLNLVFGVTKHTTYLEDVADFLAEDLGKKSQEWVGRKVGMKQHDKVD